MQRKTANCIDCNQLRLIYSKNRCQQCYWKSRPKNPIQKKPYKIAKRSKKGQKEDRLYSKLSKQFKIDNPYCKVKLDGCTHLTTDVHHRKGRGIYLNEPKYWLPVCRSCHTKIELNPSLSIAKGFSISRLKDES